MWQDYIIAACQWIFILALIPAIRHPSDKPPLSSSLLTGLLLAVLAATFFTLELWNGTLSCLALAATWFFLGYQRWKIDKGSIGSQK